MSLRRSNAFFFVLAAAAGIAVGGAAGKYFDSSGPGSGPETRREDKTAEALGHAGPARDTANVSAEKPAARPDGFEREYERALERLNLKDRHRKVARALKGVEGADGLIRTIVLSAFQDEVMSDGADLFQRSIRVLEAEPGETAKVLVQALDRMPAEFERERQEMIQFAAYLEIGEEQKLEILTNEMHRPVRADSAEGVGLFGPAVAFQTALDIHGGPKEPEENPALDPAKQDYSHRVLEEALQAHEGNPEVQRALIYTYAGTEEEYSLDLLSRWGLNSAE